MILMKSTKMKVRMGEILSLKIKNNMEELKSLVPRPAPGVPDNALPGWADVPLYDKLPMLDCPGNAIVFTGGKMGKVQKFQGAYDSNCNNEANEYNSLVDPHLTNFYMRKRNLDHLKKIGKITENNDVICNAQQFNEYRRKLNRYHLFAIYKELKRREQERDDRANIQHAENVVDQDRKKVSDDPCNVHQTKILCVQKKHEKNVANYQKIEEKIQRIKKLNELKLIILQQKKVLHNIAIEQHQLAKSDLLRMRIIAVKRNNRIRTERSRIHIKNYYENTKQSKMERAQVIWQRQLMGRRKKHERNVKLIASNAQEKSINVEKRKKLSQKRWQNILIQIAQKSENKRKKGGKTILIQKLEKFLKTNIPNTESSSMGVVTRKDISEAVDTALLFGPRRKCNTDVDSSSIYDTAKYIIENILFMINEDLSTNEQLMCHVSQQIDQYFTNGKEGIIKKISNIIKQIDTNLHSQNEIKNNLSDHRISFNKKDRIGDSAMQENLALVLKPVRSRTPTPAGSLTSLLGIMKYEFLEDPKSLEQHEDLSYTKEQMIFAEHFLIKFKRLFIVGVERKVFQAIQLYQKGKLYDFNRKLLKIDRQYLIDIMSQSILAYNINRCDFEGNLRLCISAISSDIIWDLQNNYMRPIIDPKCIRYPKSRCNCQPIHCFGVNEESCGCHYR